MQDAAPDPDEAHPPLTTEEFAALAGTTVDRLARFIAAGVLRPIDGARFTAGDVHQVRLLEGFETAGVPLEALVAGTSTGQLDFTAYHELHPEPGLMSTRSYGEFRTAADPDGHALASLFGAFGLAEPDAASRLGAEEERLVEDWVGLLAAIDEPSLAIRVVRLFAEAARRSSEAALDVYAEAASRLGPDPGSIDPDAYARLLGPWARAARALPALAAWLTERHLRRAIDAFSIETSERLLAAAGYVPSRTVALPGIAFVDLTGYTRTTQELGDEAAAGLSLRLGELARTIAEAHRGRLVKLLGDGALLHLPDARSGVAATMELLAGLPGAGLPGGHAGVHRGPIIEREGDVFGRTVNLAARLADRAPDGDVYVTADVVEDLAGSDVGTKPIGVVDLQGIGPVELHRVIGPAAPAG